MRVWQIIQRLRLIGIYCVILIKLQISRTVFPEPPFSFYIYTSPALSAVLSIDVLAFKLLKISGDCLKFVVSLNI